MAEGVFTITELMPDGREIRRFGWTADLTPPSGFKGGARAVPKKTWDIGGKQRNNRIDYPGSDGEPTQQILGYVRDDQTFKGRWDDRHNFPGYAKQTMLEFEELVARGNRVRIQYASQVFVGVIVEHSAPYLMERLIDYSFTLSVHRRGHDELLASLEGFGVGPIPIGQSVDNVESYVLAMEEIDGDRPQHIVGELGDTVANAMNDLSVGLGVLQASLDNTEVTVVVDDAITPFRRLSTQLRSIRGASIDTVQSTYDARSDVSLATKDAINALNFEVWTRGIRENGRRLSSVCYDTALEVEERDAPAAQSLYRPFAGQSIYAVALRFFGTADAWRLIAERNSLRTITLTGDELLVIPERGQG